jgi:uncharacterized protein (TIGR02284 family)
MKNINNNIIEKLNHLIAIARYSQSSYTTAAENVKNEVVKNSFVQCAHERALDITELGSIIKSLGGLSKENGNITETSDKKEMDIPSAFTLVDEDLVINKCIISDGALITAYTEALIGNKIFGNIRDILLYQLEGVKNAMKGTHAYSKKVS